MLFKRMMKISWLAMVIQLSAMGWSGWCLSMWTMVTLLGFSSYYSACEGFRLLFIVGAWAKFNTLILRFSLWSTSTAQVPGWWFLNLDWVCGHCRYTQWIEFFPRVEGYLDYHRSFSTIFSRRITIKSTICRRQLI